VGIPLFFVAGREEKCFTEIKYGRNLEDNRENGNKRSVHTGMQLNG
jgi:hypothetical protein